MNSKKPQLHPSLPAEGDFQAIVAKIANLSKAFTYNQIDFETFARCSEILNQEEKKLRVMAFAIRTMKRCAEAIVRDRRREPMQAAPAAKNARILLM